MDFYLRYGQTFPVPTAVAENLLRIASHDQLKVLLYVLCRAETAVSTDQIAQACNVLPDAVEDALAFWKNVNILRTDEAQPVVVLSRSTAPQEPAPAALPPAETAVQKHTAAAQTTSSRFSIPPSEIAARIEQNQTVAEMFRAVEQLAGKPLTPTEQKSLIWMNEYLGLQPDLLLMLAAFCIEQNVFHVRYMERIAVEWHDRGVMTHALVQEDIQRRTLTRTYVGQIMKLFQMQRVPTSKQQAFINKWHADGFSVEMVRIAYEITRDKKDDRLSFPYLDGILRKWKAAGIRTPEQAKAADLAFLNAKKNAAENPSGSSIDRNELDELMKQI